MRKGLRVDCLLIVLTWLKLRVSSGVSWFYATRLFFPSTELATTHKSWIGWCRYIPPPQILFFSAVYGSPRVKLRKFLYNELAGFSDTVNGNWLVVGDFNEIAHVSEKFGGKAPKCHKMNPFNSCINDCNLIDVGFHGQRFTWTNRRRVNPIMERIDKAFVSPQWLTTFPDTALKHLPRLFSDHCPNLLRTSNLIPMSRTPAFKFEPMWCPDPSFNDLISSSWAAVHGPFFHRILTSNILSRTGQKTLLVASIERKNT